MLQDHPGVWIFEMVDPAPLAGAVLTDTQEHGNEFIPRAKWIPWKKKRYVLSISRNNPYFSCIDLQFVRKLPFTLLFCLTVPVLLLIY